MKPEEPIVLILTILMGGGLRATPAESASLIYKAQICLSVRTYVRFNSSEPTGHTNIKHSTIDLHPRVSVIKVFMASL